MTIARLAYQTTTYVEVTLPIYQSSNGAVWIDICNLLASLFCCCWKQHSFMSPRRSTPTDLHQDIFHYVGLKSRLSQ